MGFFDRLKDAINRNIKKIEEKTGVNLPGGYSKRELKERRSRSAPKPRETRASYPPSFKGAPSYPPPSKQPMSRREDTRSTKKSKGADATVVITDPGSLRNRLSGRAPSSSDIAKEINKAIFKKQESEMRRKAALKLIDAKEQQLEERKAKIQEAEKTLAENKKIVDRGINQLLQLKKSIKTQYNPDEKLVVNIGGEQKIMTRAELEQYVNEKLYELNRQRHAINKGLKEIKQVKAELPEVEKSLKESRSKIKAAGDVQLTNWQSSRYGVKGYEFDILLSDQKPMVISKEAKEDLGLIPREGDTEREAFYLAMTDPEYVKREKNMPPWLKKLGYYRAKIGGNIESMSKAMSDYISNMITEPIPTLKKTGKRLYKTVRHPKQFIKGAYETEKEVYKEYGIMGVLGDVATMYLISEITAPIVGRATAPISRRIARSTAPEPKLKMMRTTAPEKLAFKGEKTSFWGRYEAVIEYSYRGILGKIKKPFQERPPVDISIGGKFKGKRFDLDAIVRAAQDRIGLHKLKGRVKSETTSEGMVGIEYGKLSKTVDRGTQKISVEMDIYSGKIDDATKMIEFRKTRRAVIKGKAKFVRYSYRRGATLDQLISYRLDMIDDLLNRIFSKGRLIARLKEKKSFGAGTSRTTVVGGEIKASKPPKVGVKPSQDVVQHVANIEQKSTQQVMISLNKAQKQATMLEEQAVLKQSASYIARRYALRTAYENIARRISINTGNIGRILSTSIAALLGIGAATSASERSRAHRIAAGRANMQRYERLRLESMMMLRQKPVQRFKHPSKIDEIMRMQEKLIEKVTTRAVEMPEQIMEQEPLIRNIIVPPPQLFYPRPKRIRFPIRRGRFNIGGMDHQINTMLKVIERRMRKISELI